MADNEEPEIDEMEEEEELDDDADIDVGDGEDEVSGDDDVELEVEPKPKSKKKRKEEPLTEVKYEDAVRVNPKRASALKKTRSLVESILEDSKLESEEEVKKAWEELNEKVDTKKARKYALNDDFQPNDAIKHKKFGVGFVNQKLSPTKVEVIFEDGIRRLACNR